MSKKHKLFYGELRLGNLVENQKGELGKIVELSFIGVVVKDVRFDFRIICKRVPADDNPNIVLSNERGDIFTGIKLDEGWLIACRFNKLESDQYKHEQGMIVKYRGGGVYCDNIACDYLHELQNIYFRKYLSELPFDNC